MKKFSIYLKKASLLLLGAADLARIVITDS